jgi:hypothetical protein
MYVMSYALLLQKWHPVKILVMTNCLCLRVGCHKSLLRLSKVGTQAAQIAVMPATRGSWHEAAISNRQNFLDTLTSFARANSISDVPHGPGLAFNQAVFGMPSFLVDPVLAGGGTVLDDEARPGPAFVFLAASFLTPHPSFSY